jgi:hypothetical protein
MTLDENQICIVHDAGVHHVRSCRWTTSISQLQPQPKLQPISHLCLGIQQHQPGPKFDPRSGGEQDIDAALQGKGLQKVQESQKPDLILLASGGMKQQTSWSAWGMRGIGGGMGGITPQQNVEATLIVDLHDTKSQSLVWRGIAQDTLSNNGNKNQQLVQKAIQKMFKQWPAS